MPEAVATLKIVGKDQASNEIKKVQRAVGDLEQSAAKAKKSSESFLGPLSSRFSTAAVVAGLGLLGKGAIAAASNLEELESKARFVFGDVFSQVATQSAAIANEVGRANSTILQMAADYGAIIQPMGLATEQAAEMSTTMAKLAVDMSSFHNTSQADAFIALRSAITGETEPMKRFGVVMTQTNLAAFALSKGIKTKVENMNQAQQTALRYNYLLDKTAQAQGDAARTASSFANQSRKLSEEWKQLNEQLGKEITPVAASGLGALSSYLSNVFVPAVKIAAESWASFIGSFGGFKAGNGQTVGDNFKEIFGGSPGEVWGLVTGKSKEIKNYQVDLGMEDRLKAAGQAANGAQGDVKKLVESLAGNGPSSLAGGSKDAADELDKVKDAMEDLGRSYDHEGREITNRINDLERNHRQKMADMGDQMEDLQGRLKDLAKDFDREMKSIDQSQADLLLRTGDRVADLQTKLDDLLLRRESIVQAGGSVSLEMQREIDRTQSDLAKEQTGLANIQSKTGVGVFGTSADSITQLSSSVKTLSEDLSELKRKRDELVESGQTVGVGLTMSIDNTQARLNEANSQLDKAKSGASSDVLGAFNERSGMTDAERSFADSEARRTERTEDHNKAIADTNDEIAKVKEKMATEEEAYTQTRQQLELTRNTLNIFRDDYTKAMSNIDKVTASTVKNLKQQFEDLQSTISQIDALVASRSDLTGGSSTADRVKARRDGRLENTPDSFLVPNALGGIYDEPTAALIGEAGYPEAVIPMPFGNVPVKLQGGAGNQTISISISSVVIREEADIQKVAGQLARMIQKEQIRSS